MKRINDDIKNNNLKRIYLLYGDEAYLRKQYKDMLKKAIVGDDDVNYTYYEGKDISVPTVIDQAETMPFFAERRLIIIENSGLFKSGGDEFNDYLKTAPETTYFVIVEAEIDKRSKLFKTCQSLGVAAEMTTPDEMTLKRWMAKMFADNGKKIRERDAVYLLDTVGEDMVNLKNEIEKLISYTGERDEVTADDIDEICIKQINNHIYEMVEAIGNKNLKKALDLYYELIKLRESPFRILSLVSRQYNLLLQTKELVLNHASKSQISDKIKVPPFVVNKYTDQAGMFDMSVLKEALNQCVQADEDIKAGRLGDKLSVELLIVALGQL